MMLNLFVFSSLSRGYLSSRLPALVTQILLAFAGALVVAAQTPSEPKKGADQVRPTTPSVTFTGSKFTLGYAGRGNNVIVNEYFLPKQGPMSWSHLIAMHIYPKVNDTKAQVANMAAALKKRGVSHEIVPVKMPKAAAIIFTDSNEKLAEYNIFFFHLTKNGKTMIGRQFATRATLDKKDAMLAVAKKSQSAWLGQLISAKFPSFTFPKKSATAQAPAPDLSNLKFVEEKVKDVRHTGKLIVVDQAYLKKQGAKDVLPAPFSIVIPRGLGTNKVFITGKPKVPELIRVTLATKDKQFLESIRFASLRIPPEQPQKQRIISALTLIEQQTVPQFFKGYVGGKVGGRYMTKVGPYDAGVILAQMSTKEGKKLYVKFVTILEKGHTDGLMAVMMLDPATNTAEETQERLRNGVVQQLLHTLRFEKR